MKIKAVEAIKNREGEVSYKLYFYSKADAEEFAGKLKGFPKKREELWYVRISEDCYIQMEAENKKNREIEAPLVFKRILKTELVMNLLVIAAAFFLPYLWVNLELLVLAKIFITIAAGAFIAVALSAIKYMLFKYQEFSHQPAFSEINIESEAPPLGDAFKIENAAQYRKDKKKEDDPLLLTKITAASEAKKVVPEPEGKPKLELSNLKEKFKKIIYNAETKDFLVIPREGRPIHISEDAIEKFGKEQFPSYSFTEGDLKGFLISVDQERRTSLSREPGRIAGFFKPVKNQKNSDVVVVDTSAILGCD